MIDYEEMTLEEVKAHHNWVERIVGLSLARRAGDHEIFEAADAASGCYECDDGLEEYRRLFCTSAWLLENATGKWRQTMDDDEVGSITFEFEVRADAVAFRKATGADWRMIPCE